MSGNAVQWMHQTLQTHLIVFSAQFLTSKKYACLIAMLSQDMGKGYGLRCTCHLFLLWRFALELESFDVVVNLVCNFKTRMAPVENCDPPMSI